MELTQKEKDLIEMIRNFWRVRPNGEREIELYIYEILLELLYED